MCNDPAPTKQRLPLKQRVISAGTWTLASYGVSQAIRFGSNLVMTRLLVPDMFGVMAIATTMMAGLAMFSDLGLKPNIVQSKRGSDPVFLNTAWMVQIFRGVGLWMVGLGISLLVAIADHIGVFPKNSVYADYRLPAVIAILSFSTVIAGFSSTKVLEASRNLAFARVSQNQIIAQIIGLLCMFAWVSLDRSIWALVAGGPASALAMVVLSHVRLPGVANRWQWDNTAFREIILFGKWIFVASILGFLAAQVDRLLLGGLIDSTTFGVYAIAFLIFSSVDQLLMKIISEVSFPALSEIAREKPGGVKEGHYRFHVFIAPFAYICSGILLMSGQSLVALLYDPRYVNAGWMLEILAVALLTTPFRAAGRCFMALGMPHLLSRTLVVRLAMLLALMPIGFVLFGLAGALAGLVMSYCSEVFVSVWYMKKLRLFDLRQEIILIPGFLVGLMLGEGINYAVEFLPGSWDALTKSMH